MKLYLGVVGLQHMPDSSFLGFTTFTKFACGHEPLPVLSLSFSGL